MKKESLPFEESSSLRELGFNEECFGGWDKDGKWWYHPDSDIIADAPLYRQAFSFFREKYKLYATLPRSVRSETFAYVIATESDGWFRQQDGFKTYEEAELECIKTLIEIVNKKS